MATWPLNFATQRPLTFGAVTVAAIGVVCLAVLQDPLDAALTAGAAVILLTAAWRIAVSENRWTGHRYHGLSEALVAASVALLLLPGSEQVHSAVALTLLVGITCHWLGQWLNHGLPGERLALTTLLLALGLGGATFALWRLSTVPIRNSSDALFGLAAILAASAMYGAHRLAPQEAVLCVFSLALLIDPGRFWIATAVVAVAASGIPLARRTAPQPSGETINSETEVTARETTRRQWVPLVGLIGVCLLALATTETALYLPVAMAATVAVVLHGFGIASDLHNARALVSTLECRYRDLSQRSQLDSLTGLPNRSALETRMQEEVERALRYQQPLAVCFVDIDHFKQINDELGHAGGDIALQQVARAIRSAARTVDFVARYGGEEFVVLAPGTWSGDGLILGERLRASVAGMVRGPSGAPVSISIGVAGLPEHASTAEELLIRSDAALYEAKRRGRGRCVIFNDGDELFPRAPCGRAP